MDSSSMLPHWASAFLLLFFVGTSALGNSATDVPTRASEEPAAQATSTRTHKLEGGIVLHASPDASYQLGGIIKLTLGPGSGTTPARIVELSSGRIDVEAPIVEQPAAAVLIRAPRKVSAVARGGHSVVVVAENAVSAAALDAPMLVAHGDAWKPLDAGAIRTFSDENFRGEVHPVLRAPSFENSQPIAMATPGRDSLAEFEVRTVPGARGYEIELRAEGAAETVRTVSSPSPLIEVRGLPPGAYSVRAIARDAHGIESPKGPAASVRVVSLELPPKARMVDNAIELGKRQRVRLSGARGLEMSYGKASIFVPAPDSVGLMRDEPTVVRLRVAGQKQETRFWLTPRDVRAHVSISPRNARWPHDALRLSVRLVDGRNQALDESVEVVTKVLVNVETVDVTWKRDGALLSATLPPVKSEGPWVVRVEVADELGQLIGRNFLEVAGSRKQPLSLNAETAR